ncbi:MAG: hypothetical protein QXN21_03225 [Candidatus Bathyarchaeia archaeon]
MELKYKRFFKPLIARSGPTGVYSDLRFWTEAGDLEGLNLNFSYGFIKDNRAFHPLDEQKMLVHPYHELLVFVGIDTNDVTRLGAEVSIELGKEPEEYTFDRPTVVIIPAGTPHGPAKVRKSDMPVIAHYHVGLGPEWKADFVLKKPRSSEQKYAHLVKPLKSTVLPHYKPGLVDEKGVMYASAFVGPANADQLIWMYGRDLEGLDVNISWGFYSKCGAWHKSPETRGGAHVHPVDEALYFVGLDPSNIYYFGAEIEEVMGENQEERYIINRPAVMIFPRGVVHGPITTRFVEKPYAMIIVCLSSGHETYWLPAPPHIYI